ncbi:MAG: hypothetical protein UR60_C0037G0001 [Candidatus Moranbacteria bacterium GW2011_GWF2_34_56]|nr:MAG: hypothetical protein UR60_C0037G0001 [Candidatus Moranbacteria bacterium GW2011_GWF2_34_56]
MKNNNLTDGNIPQQIKMIAVPASVGFFFNTMYNVVDTYFGGAIFIFSGFLYDYCFGFRYLQRINCAYR